jgi:hemoglobin-like flavoprotein
MTPKQIELVQSSFELVKPIAPAAAELFYARLFQLDPELKPMFRGDMKKQGQMLMSMLGTAVNGLRQFDKLGPVVRALGARHGGYGVEPHHYDTVGEAFLWTLEIGLKEEFTPEVRTAWATTYGLLAQLMQAGAREAAAQTARVD